jgi:APA family basic amino acid/polyamine antiporter
MHPFPSESPPVRPAIISTNRHERIRLPRHARQAAGFTGDALVRQEFGLDALDALDDVTINHYGPGTNRAITSILVPVAGGPHSDAAVTLANSIASEWSASLALLTVISETATDAERRDAEQRLAAYTETVTDGAVETAVVASDDVVATIAGESDEHELLVIGASEKSLFKRFFSGSVPNRLATETHAPIFVVSQ